MEEEDTKLMSPLLDQLSYAALQGIWRFELMIALIPYLHSYARTMQTRKAAYKAASYPLYNAYKLSMQENAYIGISCKVLARRSA